MTKMATLSNAEVRDDGVVSVDINGRSSLFHGFWLRDNCRCELCFHPVSLQRMVDSKAVDLDIRPKSASVSDCGENLLIRWLDDHLSEFSAKFLSQFSYSNIEEDCRVLSKHREEAKTLWDVQHWQQGGTNLPRVSWELIDEEGFGGPEHLRLLSTIRRFGFVFLDNVKPTADATQLVVNALGTIRNTIFGNFWEFSSDVMEHADTAYSAHPLDSHTDSTYFEHPTGFQLLHLIEFDGSGGRSGMVDGFKVAEHIRETDPESFEILTTVPLLCQYLDRDRKVSFYNKTIPFRLDQDGSVTLFSSGF